MPTTPSYIYAQTSTKPIGAAKRNDVPLNFKVAEDILMVILRQTVATLSDSMPAGRDLCNFMLDSINSAAYCRLGQSRDPWQIWLFNVKPFQSYIKREHYCVSPKKGLYVAEKENE